MLVKPIRKWIAKHKSSVWVAVFTSLLSSFPLWAGGIFSLFSDKPLIPWLISLKIPMPSPSLFWIAIPVGAVATAVFYWRENRRQKLEAVSLELVSETDPKSFWMTYWKLTVRNSSNKPIQNVRVEIVSMRQSISGVHDLSTVHPILYADDFNGTINPKAAVPFDFFFSETKGGNRKLTLQGRAGLQVFEFGLNELISKHTIMFSVQVSCLEFSPVDYMVEIKMEAVPLFDSGSAPFGKGFDISIRKEK